MNAMQKSFVDILAFGLKVNSDATTHIIPIKKKYSFRDIVRVIVKKII